MSAEVRGRINILHKTSNQLSALAKESLPENIPLSMVAECKQYDEWLNRVAKEILSLATKWEGEMRNASREMQEASKSFTQQYLALQNKLQNENRQYTTFTNVMKTKHDTAKAAINNIR